MEEKWRNRRMVLSLLIPFPATTHFCFFSFHMDSLLLFLNLFSLSFVLVSGIPFTEFVYPNITASNLKFIDGSGSFLFSRNGTFKAAMFNPNKQQTRFYLCIIHSKSNTIIWSANHDSPVSSSGTMSLNMNGISINEQDGNLAWSTPPFHSLVSALQLTEEGNLILLDQSNSTLWESFLNPTDTIVIGQKLLVGTALFGAVSSDDLSSGDYGLLLAGSDAVLQWQGLTYWKLSMEPTAYANSNYAVEFLQINQTGLYLFGHNGSAVVIQINLPRSDFRMVKIDESGQFIITSFSGASEKKDFAVPVDDCQIPYICGKVGLCGTSISSDHPICSCPSSFHLTSDKSCVPSGNSYLLPGSCNSTTNRSQLNSSNISYLQLGNSVDYFANGFSKPANYGVSLPTCQNLCSNDCSCLGIFFDNSSGSCYMIENEIGSVMQTTKRNNRVGFIKAVLRASPLDFDDNQTDEVGFPIVAVVLLPASGLLLILAIGILLCKKYSLSNIKNFKSSYSSFLFFGDGDFSIPGLPLRFDYKELVSATNDFKIKIGAGGFGTVYKGLLPDNSLVAVKKINNLGIRSKKDFCTEIAIIGSIHHVNLVKLRGFCAQGRQLLLVYEYMNRGSLDKTLFGNGPVLEWQERVEIAIGAARGLAYLHSGCEQKIIHCDIKPENILVHDQFHVKISDFGLSKLLTREQSSHITTMRGTRGYLAPEWLTSSAISEKTDVYSFGMVLLEIISGRKNCATRSQSHENSNSTLPLEHGIGYFPLYALEMHERGKYLELVDSRLEGRVGNEDAEKMVRVALCCVHEEPGLRPSMVNVVGMLEGNVPLVAPRLESLNFLRFYGRRFSEASMLEEEGELNDTIMLYPDANGSHISTTSVSGKCFSYISSQQISGPR